MFDDKAVPRPERLPLRDPGICPPRDAPVREAWPRYRRLLPSRPYSTGTAPHAPATRGLPQAALTAPSANPDASGRTLRSAARLS